MSDNKGALVFHSLLLFKNLIDSGNPSRLSTILLVNLNSFSLASNFRLIPAILSFNSRISLSVRSISNCLSPSFFSKFSIKSPCFSVFSVNSFNCTPRASISPCRPIISCWFCNKERPKDSNWLVLIALFFSISKMARSILCCASKYSSKSDFKVVWLALILVNSSSAFSNKSSSSASFRFSSLIRERYSTTSSSNCVILALATLIWVPNFSLLSLVKRERCSKIRFSFSISRIPPTKAFKSFWLSDKFFS